MCERFYIVEVTSRVNEGCLKVFKVSCSQRVLVCQKCLEWGLKVLEGACRVRKGCFKVIKGCFKDAEKCFSSVLKEFRECD